MRRKIFSTIAIAIVVLMCNQFTYAATPAELNAKKSELDKKANEAKNQLSNVKDEKETATNELDTINNSITTVNNEISKLTMQLDELNGSISTKQKEIDAKQKEIKEKEELLKKRLVAMYKNGKTSYLDVLLSSDNYIDVLASYDAVKEIAQADTNLIEQIAEQKTQLENSKKDLETKKSEVDSVKAQKESKNTELVALQKTKQAKVSQLSSEEKQLQSDIDSYNAAMKQVDNQIAAAFKAAQEALKKQQSSGSSSSGSSVNGAGLKFDGSFIWPCNNKTVTSRMKYRWGRWHKGIDIGASFENVYASASGIFVGPLYNPGGYGTYCMVIHGNNFVTLYGHLNRTIASSGSNVKQGQVIAQSGNTGNGVTHLHFEIRKASGYSDFFGNNWLDPLSYLPGGYTINE